MGLRMGDLPIGKLGTHQRSPIKVMQTEARTRLAIRSLWTCLLGDTAQPPAVTWYFPRDRADHENHVRGELSFPSRDPDVHEIHLLYKRNGVALAAHSSLVLERLTRKQFGVVLCLVATRYVLHRGHALSQFRFCSRSRPRP